MRPPSLNAPPPPLSFLALSLPLPFPNTPPGTIGAKNQGKGIVGVAPGVGIYGIRVLRADGNGAFSDLVRTYDHLLKEGRRLGVRVVNLSLSGSGTAEDVECQYISQLIAQGMTVVTAAGEAEGEEGGAGE